MPGTPDHEKRNAVRKYLVSKVGRDSTDREASRCLGFSRYLVTTVRVELIASGKIPPRGKAPHQTAPILYSPGLAIRGGYVLDDRGRIVSKEEWKNRLRTESSLRRRIDRINNAQRRRQDA